MDFDCVVTVCRVVVHDGRVIRFLDVAPDVVIRMPLKYIRRRRRRRLQQPGRTGTASEILEDRGCCCPPMCKSSVPSWSVFRPGRAPCDRRGEQRQIQEALRRASSATSFAQRGRRDSRPQARTACHRRGGQEGAFFGRQREKRSMCSNWPAAIIAYRFFSVNHFSTR